MNKFRLLKKMKKIYFDLGKLNNRNYYYMKEIENKLFKKNEIEILNKIDEENKDEEILIFLEEHFKNDEEQEDFSKKIEEYLKKIIRLIEHEEIQYDI